MTALGALRSSLGAPYGVLAESSTNQLSVIARNTDVAIGDLFLLPCRRGGERFYVFRTTEYANVMNRTLEMNDVARNKLTMPDSYFAEDLADEKLVELRGLVLGYAQHVVTEDRWTFHRPRRLPQHLSDVFHVSPRNAEVGEVVRELLESQLGAGGLFIGHLLAGERALPQVPVCIPPRALSHHIGIFGRTGCGKSNQMMVLLRSVFDHNRVVLEGGAGSQPVSIFAIDPHDEFRSWHRASGGASGVQGLVEGLSAAERTLLVEPFYYLSARDLGSTGLERRVRLSRADLTPADLVSVMDFSEQQVAFTRQFFAQHGENWIARLLAGDTDGDEDAAEYLPGTIAAVQRRVGFLSHGSSRIFTRFAPEVGLEYESSLPEIICALETGRILVVDTTLMGELEQFLLNTVVARVLFVLRRALRASETAADLTREIRHGLANDDAEDRAGSRTLADELVARLESGDLPYLRDGAVRAPDQLPHVNIVVEEAPSILNPQRMKFGSVFRDISRQGRKFGIGLTVISQQVSEIDKGVLTQLNTELTLALGNADERREAVRNASADLGGFAQELQVLGRGQAILSTSFRDVALPIQAPNYDELAQSDPETTT